LLVATLQPKVMDASSEATLSCTSIDPPLQRLTLGFGGLKTNHLVRLKTGWCCCARLIRPQRRVPYSQDETRCLTSEKSPQILTRFQCLPHLLQTRAAPQCYSIPKITDPTRSCRESWWMCTSCGGRRWKWWSSLRYAPPLLFPCGGASPVKKPHHASEWIVDKFRVFGAALRKLVKPLS
jgi:hypothetical protein